MKALSQELLADRTFDIEFHGYLTNHVKHAIVALDRLGASEARIQEYWDMYTFSTPYHIPLHKVENPWEAVTPASPEDWEEWKGRKLGWQQLVKFLEEQHRSNEELVKDYAPGLLGGIAGALTHGIIHLGWAVDAGSPWMVKEGLAYLNFCYLPAAPVKSKAIEESDATTSLLRVAKEVHEKNLRESWIEFAKSKYDEGFHPELVEAGFQWRLAAVLKEAHPVATDIPSWVREKPLDDVFEELYRIVGLLYLATRSSAGDGNFIVLHLLTSLWGLEKVCEVIAQEETSRDALEGFWEVAISTANALSCGFPTHQVLQSALDQYPLDCADTTAFDWSGVVELARAEEEEHNIKLVYVARELWRKYDRWIGFSESAKSFTVTPRISSGSAASSAN